MLEINGLVGGWGGATVVEGVDLAVGSGRTVALVGRNGVGKTTLLEVLAGRARQFSGTIRLNGVDISKFGPHQRCRAGLGYVPQTREIFPSLTIMEHLAVARRPGAWTAERLFELFPSLKKRSRNLAANLSGGEQQMLAIARALIANPKLLVMDEPSEGLAPVVIDQLVEAIRKVAASGELDVLLVEQRVDIALELSDQCHVMERGQLKQRVDKDKYLGDPAKWATLLGLAH